MQLLSNGNKNSKLKKNERESYILYLAPFNQNSKGINICPKATKECVAMCLYESGYATVYKKINEARKAKTEFYINDKVGFMNVLANEIRTIIKKSNGKEILFRLNGTSDLDFLYMLKTYANFDYLDTPDNIFFYDYTKIIGKVKKYKDYVNKYRLTFSYTGENHKECYEALKLGANISMVYKGNMPNEWNGFEVIDGDKSDEEMFKFNSKVLGLKLKGNKQNKMDSNKFVFIN